jgi:hypothetical protein
MPRGYEDDYGRREVSGRRDDRHTRDRVEPRERTRPEEPRDYTRTARADPMEVVDARTMTSRGLGDSRPANAGARLEPRPDRHTSSGVETRTREEPLQYTDPRTGRPVDMRAATTDQYSRDPAGRYSTPRDDRMDTEMDMQPRRPAGREVVDSGRDHEMDDHKGDKYNNFFVPGTGM